MNTDEIKAVAALCYLEMAWVVKPEAVQAIYLCERFLARLTEQAEPVAWLNEALPHMAVRFRPDKGGNWYPVFTHPEPEPAEEAESVAEVVEATEYDPEGKRTHLRDIDYYQSDLDLVPAGTKLYTRPIHEPAERAEPVAWIAPIYFPPNPTGRGIVSFEKLCETQVPLYAHSRPEPAPHEQKPQLGPGCGSQTSQCEVKSSSKSHVGAAPLPEDVREMVERLRAGCEDAVHCRICKAADMLERLAYDNAALKYSLQLDEDLIGQIQRIISVLANRPVIAAGEKK